MNLELEQAGSPFDAEVMIMIPVIYKDMIILLGFRADFLVDGAVIVDIKAVSALLPAHQAQLLTYLRMSGISVGLLMNFHASLLKHGLLRLVV